MCVCVCGVFDFFPFIRTLAIKLKSCFVIISTQLSYSLLWRGGRRIRFRKLREFTGFWKLIDLRRLKKQEEKMTSFSRSLTIVMKAENKADRGRASLFSGITEQGMGTVGVGMHQCPRNVASVSHCCAWVDWLGDKAS